MPEHAILYIFDDEVATPPDFPGSARIVVCPMTTDYDLIDSVVNDIKCQVSGSVVVENYAKLFNETAFALRDPFVRFIAEFGAKPQFKGRSIRQYFTDRKSRFSLWWLSSIVERNTLISDAYRRLAALVTLKEICQQQSCTEVRLDIADSVLVRGLRNNEGALGMELRVAHSGGVGSDRFELARAVVGGFSQVGKLIAKTMTARWVMRGVGKRAPFGKARSIMLTYFPLFDQQAWNDGQFHDKFFGLIL